MAGPSLGGSGTAYPKINQINDILNNVDLDLTLGTLQNTFGEGPNGNKNALAIINAIVDTIPDASKDWSLRDVLYCPNYECAATYFPILDTILSVYKTYLDLVERENQAANAYGGAPWAGIDSAFGGGGTPAV